MRRHVSLNRMWSGRDRFPKSEYRIWISPLFPRGQNRFIEGPPDDLRGGESGAGETLNVPGSGRHKLMGSPPTEAPLPLGQGLLHFLFLRHRLPPPFPILPVRGCLKPAAVQAPSRLGEHRVFQGHVIRIDKHPPGRRRRATSRYTRRRTDSSSQWSAVAVTTASKDSGFRSAAQSGS